VGSREQTVLAVLNVTDHPALPTPSISEGDAETRLNANRFDVEALVVKGNYLFLANDHRGANSFYMAAVRAPYSSSAHSALLARAQAMVDWLAERFKNHMQQALADKGFDEANRHPRFQKSLETMWGMRERPPAFERYPQMPMLYYYPDLPYAQYANREDFVWRAPLEAAFPQMRQEALALLGDAADFRPYVTANAARPQGDVHGLLNNSDWSTYFLFENGTPVVEHIKRCPVIFETVMQHVPLCHIGPRAPSVMLSLLRPHAKIPPHSGMLNCRYICHFPLVIPPKCGFRVGEQTREWREGELMVFDDTVEHEAWNDSDQNRLVLIFDVWRPELSADEQQMVQTLFAAVDNYG
jgi:aspartyl/asparaginyl beta-hydroxylase (cupin superfamily)